MKTFLKKINRNAITDGIKRRLLGTTLIAPWWFIKIKWINYFSKKIKVGFGPVTTGENDLAERKWRIDPIINAINKKSDVYTAGFFVDVEEMDHFDLLIIVKKFGLEDIPWIIDLKIRQNKCFIYDIVDNPNSEKKYGHYFGDTPAFSEAMDGFILSSPLHEKEIQRFSSLYTLIEHPIINTTFKKYYQESDEIIILAQGYYENLKNLKILEPLIADISKESGKKIILLYHSEVVFDNKDHVRYIQWNVSNCFEMMEKADFAVTIKNLHSRHQRTKPSTKILAYMAAGLPVICLPSAADQRVIHHKVNGYFAYTTNDWKRYITLLVNSPKRRKQVGYAARNSVIDTYSIDAITDKYLSFFNRLMKNAAKIH